MDIEPVEDAVARIDGPSTEKVSKQQIRTKERITHSK